MKLKKLIPLIGVLTLFTACGGNGGGSDSNNSIVDRNQREANIIDAHKNNIRLKRVTEVTTSNYNSASTTKVEITYEYDTNNRVKYYKRDNINSGGDIVLDYIYDSNNYLVKMIGSHGYDVEYEYDNGKMIKRSDLKNGKVYQEISVLEWDNNHPVRLRTSTFYQNGVDISTENKFTGDELTHVELTMTNRYINTKSIYDTKYDLNTYHPLHYVYIGDDKREDISMTYYYEKMPIEVDVTGQSGRKILFTYTKNSDGLVTEIEEVSRFDSKTIIVINSSYEYERF
jgi:hypothetical protein